MQTDLPNAFRTALSNLEIIDSDSYKPQNTDLIPYGHFQISDDDRLCAQLCNNVALKTKAFWTLTSFLRLQNNSPEKPADLADIDSPEFDPPHLTYDSDYERELAKHYRYDQALTAYNERYQSYQKLLLQTRTVRAHYDFTDRGYVAFILATLKVDLPDFVQSFFFTPKTFYVNEEARKAHTFICAGTKSGKSQTILHLIRHYMTKNTEPALVILDPHGNLADDVARMPENATNDRLLYIKADLVKGRSIAFNPFDCTEAERQEDALYRRQVQFRGALEEIFEQEFSPAQKPFILPILGVLLHKEGTTFKDLVRFMDDERNGDLVKYGQTSIPNEENRNFFKYQFNKKVKENTKEALGARFSDLIADPSIRSFLCNPSTFDLQSSLASNKIIVFHFDQNLQSKSSIKTIGQLINAYIVSFAMARPEAERSPIHLFADECQYFVSPTIEEIMGETRKFGLYATLATQRTNQVGADLLDAILGNVGCYMIGRNKGKTVGVMSKEQPLTADEITSLPPLHFYQIELDRTPVKTKIEVVSGKYRLSGEPWRDLILEQGRRYYRTPAEFEAMQGGLPAESADYQQPFSNHNENRQQQAPEASTQRRRKPLHPVHDIS